MNKKELEAFAREAAKGMKTEKDLNEFSQMLTKVAVESIGHINTTLPEFQGVLEILCQSFNLSKRGLHNDREIRF